MKNLLIVLLTVLIVALGAFLPGLLMQVGSEPEIELDYQQVSITSESSSDYAWRMEQIAERYYGDGENQLATYISQTTFHAEEEEDTERQDTEELERFFTELEELVRAGVIPGELLDRIRMAETTRISYYYVFDETAASGFRVAELRTATDAMEIQLAMDMQSGKLAKISYSGSDLQKENIYFPENFSSWYDVLRVYADYLGLSSQGISVPDVQLEASDSSVRRFYEDITADKLAAHVTSGGNSWLELRILRDPYDVAVAVYRGQS